MYLWFPIAHWGPIPVRLTAILFYSSITQWLLIWSMEKLFEILYGWEPLSVMDSYFMMDKPETQSNSITISQFERFDAKKMKKWVHDQLCNILPRGKKRLIQRFGRWYYEPLEEAEWERRFESLIKVYPKIKTEEEFSEAIAETHQVVYELEDGQPFRFALIEDSHVPDRSYLLICIHHCYGDGNIFNGCMNACAENGFEDLVKFKRNIGFNPLLEAAGMVKGFKAFFNMLVSLDPSKKRAPEIQKEYILSKEFEMTKLKNACKAMKQPFQSSFFAILSAALADF